AGHVLRVVPQGAEVDSAHGRVEVRGGGGERGPVPGRVGPGRGIRRRGADAQVERGGHRTLLTRATASAPPKANTAESTKTSTNDPVMSTAAAPMSGAIACGTAEAMFMSPRSWRRVAPSGSTWVASAWSTERKQP